MMSSGVVRHGQLQTGTNHWKFRRNFQVGEDKPLLIHIVVRSFLFFSHTYFSDWNKEYYIFRSV